MSPPRPSHSPYLAVAAAALVCGCQTEPQDFAEAAPRPILVGRLEHRDIVEASGLARSHRQDDLLWTVNDGGAPPTLYALGTDGSDRGTVRVRAARNVDWEDLASFERDGEAWLLIADIGDNMAERDHVTLYILREPDPSTDLVVEPDRRLAFSYPDGPRDAEAVAVDAAADAVYVLSKRTIPAEIYALPLESPGRSAAVVATRVGALTALPQPSEEDVRLAEARYSWHWQPTAMDISADGRSAAILTYDGVYLYGRGDAQSWPDALLAPPSSLELGDVREAEAITIVRDGLFVTVEAKHAPLFWLDIAR